MRKVILYLTLSLDGFIADREGGVDWLAHVPDEDFGYRDFYASISTVLLGRATYEQIVAWGEAVYPDKEVYVFTGDRDVKASAPNVVVVHERAEDFVARMTRAEGGPVWVCGGGQLARAPLDARLVDEIDLFVQPIILGDGIPLFAAGLPTTALELTESRVWPAGLVEMRYRVLPPQGPDAVRE